MKGGKHLSGLLINCLDIQPWTIQTMLLHLNHGCLSPLLQTVGPNILCRGLHSVTAVDKKLYLFGGAPQKGSMLNDLWVLDTATMQWTELHPEGELPHTRCSHAAVAMSTSIVFFGGSYYRFVTALLCLQDMLTNDL